MAKKQQVDAAILVTAAEAADLVRVHRSTWYKWVAAGYCPGPVTVGGAARWRRAELEEWARAGCPGRKEWEGMRG